MGYKQELRRQYSTIQIFAVAFSIMGLVPSIASTIAFSLPAGPAGMVWVCISWSYPLVAYGSDTNDVGLVYREYFHFHRRSCYGNRYPECDASIATETNGRRPICRPRCPLPEVSIGGRITSLVISTRRC